MPSPSSHVLCSQTLWLLALQFLNAVFTRSATAVQLRPNSSPFGFLDQWILSALGAVKRCRQTKRLSEPRQIVRRAPTSLLSQPSRRLRFIAITRNAQQVARDRLDNSHPYCVSRWLDCSEESTNPAASGSRRGTNGIHRSGGATNGNSHRYRTTGQVSNPGHRLDLGDCLPQTGVRFGTG